jgi:Kef-type K+ transport system membrane component KefB
LLILFALGGFASAVGSEAVLPAYLIGMALAPAFQHDPELPHRMRVIAFAVLTPFYFLKAGSLVEAKALISGALLIALFLGMKMVTKFIGVLPLTRYYRFDNREGIYTTLLMSTGLTFGSISALYGLTDNIINQEQYTDEVKRAPSYSIALKPSLSSSVMSRSRPGLGVVSSFGP